MRLRQALLGLEGAGGEDPQHQGDQARQEDQVHGATDPQVLAPDPNQDRECDFGELTAGNQVAAWQGDRASIKHAYDHALTGPQVWSWWPGRTRAGECRDVGDASRGCWFRTRLLGDPGCNAEGHCLHTAAYDGEPTHSYTCPTWLRNEQGYRCRPPAGWQACPERFSLVRADSDVSADEFRAALSVPCADPKTGASPQDHCIGKVEAKADNAFYFDIQRNRWFRCTPSLRCEDYRIKAISDPTPGGKCGAPEKGEQRTCAGVEGGKKTYCFEHDVTDKQSQYQCVGEGQVFLISKGDDTQLAAVPCAFLLLSPPRRKGVGDLSPAMARRPGWFL